MLIGYARVSTEAQNLNLQQDELTRAGCERIFTDIASGGKDSRPGLDDCISHLRPGDTLVVWKLDRLGRSLKHLIALLEGFNQQDIQFKSLTEALDTTTAMGRLVFHLFGILAEFEREMIRERTKAGLAAARARGRYGGPKLQHSNKKIAIAQEMAASHTQTIAEICDSLGISRTTYYRRLRNQQAKQVETNYE